MIDEVRPVQKIKYSSIKFVFYLIILITIIIGSFKVAENVIKPLAISVVLGFLVYPLYSFLKKFRIPRFLIVLIIFLFLFLCSYLVFNFVYYSVSILLNQLPYYQSQLIFIIKDIFIRYKVDTSILNDINFSSYIYPFLTSISNGVIGFASSLVVVFLCLYFLLSEIHIFGIKIRLAFQEQVSSKFIDGLKTINNQISKYLAIKVFVSFLTGLMVFIGLSLFKQDFPLVWSVITFIFNFIPNIGSILAVFFITITALIQFYPDLDKVIYILIYNTALQMLIGNLLEPKLQGNRLDISPFLLLCFLFFWGWLWGIVGLLIAYPFTVIVKVIVDNVEYLKPFSIFLSGANIINDNKEN